MKSLISILICAVVLLEIDISAGQQIYFNNRYNMCQDYGDEAWSVALDIIETGNGFAFEGATVDTATYSMRRIAIFVIDNYGNKMAEKSYGNDTVDFFGGWPGSFRKSLTGEQYYLAGSKNYSQSVNYDAGLVMKFDASFDTLWAKNYDLNNDGNHDTSLIFSNIEFCDNRDLIVSGSMNASHIVLMRIDSNGTNKWYRFFHYGEDSLWNGYTVIQTSDNGFALGGFRYVLGEPETGDPVIIKTDSLGNQQWVKYMGGQILDGAAFLVRSNDGFIIMGSTYGDAMVGNDSRNRINIAKLDNSGTVLWDKKYGETKLYNRLNNIKVLSNGDIVACGCRPDDFPHWTGWIIKVSENGDSLWYREYDYLDGEQSMNDLFAVIESSYKGLLACGDVFPKAPDTGNRDAWVIRLDSIGCEWAGCDSTVGIGEHGDVGAWGHGSMEIYPNPTRIWITLTLPDITLSGELELSVYDIFGQEMFKTKSFPNSRIISLNVSNLSPGVYLVSCRIGNSQCLSGKFVVASE